MRDHQPITLDKFNGLWNRGNVEECPLDHFSDCNNLQYESQNTFGSRFGLGRHQDVASPLSNILRVYNYATSTNPNTLLVLTSGGNIYHVIDATNIFGPILTIAAMTDFGFVPYGGRAYITPFTTEVAGNLNRERGLTGEHVYVYLGAGVAARKAGGTNVAGTLTVANGVAGLTDGGVHIFGVVNETDTGYLTPPGALVAFTTAPNFSVDFTNVPVSPDSFVVKRHIVASKVIQTYNGDVNGYDLFFVPGGEIPNNVATSLSNISFFDSDLLEDATHLKDNFSQIPAGVGMCIYHNRLCLWTEFDNTSIVRVSSEGEPEAINQITGLLTIPPDGNYITNAAELRDVLYVMKRNRTFSFVDNGEDPTSWPLTVVDAAMGCGVHGIGSVLDSGGSNIDYLLVGTYKGIAMFNGRYILPELTWKISAVWAAQNFLARSRYTQILNDPVKECLYIVTTDNDVLYGQYSNGFDPKNIRWSPWTFDVKVNSLALINISDLILGCDQV